MASPLFSLYAVDLHGNISRPTLRERMILERRLKERLTHRANGTLSRRFIVDLKHPERSQLRRVEATLWTTAEDQ